MPTMLTARVAAPRTASADPAATGETATMAGSSCRTRRSACHWSIDRTRCNGIWTIASSKPGRKGLATSSRGCSVMWAWALSTRLVRLACRPVSRADMKTITAMPTETPDMMNSVCMRPSRRKRSAAIHSNGIHLFMRNRPQTLAVGYGGVRPDHPVSRRESLGDLDLAAAAQSDLHRLTPRPAAVDLEHPGSRPL